MVRDLISYGAGVLTVPVLVCIWGLVTGARFRGIVTYEDDAADDDNFSDFVRRTRNRPPERYESGEF